MKALFESCLLDFSLFGIGAVSAAAFALVLLQAAVREVGTVTRRATGSKGAVAFIVPAVYVCVMFLYGGGKSNAPAGNQYALSPVLAEENHAAAPARVEKWWRRGAYDDGEILCFEDDWCFPYGSNHLSSVEVWASGAVYPSEKCPTPIAKLATKLSLAPQDSEVFMGRTMNNTYRIEWRKGHPNRDKNVSADAAIELFRNGNSVVIENGAATLVPYEIPFAHTGVGQDETWVRANFTNAEEIVALGYTNWVDRQVGVGLTNGLYKFTAFFADDPPEPTQLYIGDYSVCVTNAGEYIFVLEKGEEYEFGTWPFDGNVAYWARDDLADDVPMPTARLIDGASSGEWTVDGGEWWFSLPSVSCGLFYDGRIAWWPTMQGSPNVTLLKPQDLTKQFSAVVSDHSKPDDLQYEWKTSDEKVRIMSPRSKDTMIEVDSMPSWGYFDLSVSTEINRRSYTSSVRLCYGTNDTPVASLVVSAPKVVFVNDDNRDSRWYHVLVKLLSPTATNAVLSVSHTGGAQIVYASDSVGRNRFEMKDVNLSVRSPMSSDEYGFYFAATNNNCTGTFKFACTLADSSVLAENREYKVIEPLRKLVSSSEATDGGYINPCRLIYGTNAWLEVNQNGTFQPQDIRWRIVSGPGEIVSSNRYRACVRATESRGTVVVESAFGSDALVQPRFVLPIAQKRRMAVKAFAVADADGFLAVTESMVDGRLDNVNKIYSQVGIEFYRCGPVCAITNSSFRVVETYALTTNSHGRVRQTRYPSSQVSNLVHYVRTYSSSAHEINLVWVNDIVGGSPIAFTWSTERVCVFAKNYQNASYSVCAHEIGHVLGLKDVYNARKRIADPMPQSELPVYEEVFSLPEIDWVGDDGRGFYEITDTHRDIIELLLMHGRDSGGTDIPSGSVRGFPSQPRNVFDIRYIPVGAASILQGGCDE